MTRSIKKFTWALAFSLTMAAPLLADDTSDCYDRVLASCAEALEDANWYEKIALGVLCTGMLAGCTSLTIVT